MKSSPSEIRQALPYFTGSQSFTRWSPLFPNCLLTEGALHIAESCGAYWLMDAIGSHQYTAEVAAEDFQVWELIAPAHRVGQPAPTSWLLSMEDGNSNRVARQEIEYSDYPLPEGITIWACRNERGGLTLMLPSEY